MHGTGKEGELQQKKSRRAKKVKERVSIRKKGKKVRNPGLTGNSGVKFID
jgi:hypothetical protein